MLFSKKGRDFMVREGISQDIETKEKIRTTPGLTTGGAIPIFV
jgi:hypothetical protein